MMLLGGALKRRERLSARLGDVLSYLYLASAALKRYHDLGSPEHMQPLLRWAMEESLGQAEQALDRLLDNFPNRFVGCALRVLVFPFGRRHTGPSDELDAEVAALIGRSKGDPALEELLAGCFRPQAEGDPVAALQRAATCWTRLRHCTKRCIRRSRRARYSQHQAVGHRCGSSERCTTRRRGATAACSRKRTQGRDRCGCIRQGAITA